MDKKENDIEQSSDSHMWQIACNRKRRKAREDREYNRFLNLLLDDETLQTNGYPRPYSPDYAMYYNIPYERSKAQKRDAKIWECCRCKESYEVRFGKPVMKQTCRFHPRGLTFEVGQPMYSCCNNPKWSQGCMESDTHVINRLEDEKSFHGKPIREGFVYTCTRKPLNEQNRNIYGIDCEMCFTTCGMELIRVTVVNIRKEVVYDSLVLPENEILDYATCYSGITAEDMKNVSKTLKDVQQDFLRMFCSQTIFIGHSLENDLNALKCVHNKIIDTSILFVHPNYRTKLFKYSLKVLAKSILGKEIQSPAKRGHDSVEDAVTAVELVINYLENAILYDQSDNFTLVPY